MAHVFVTVGTTSFDRLVAAACTTEVLAVLHSQGYRTLTIQYGRGNYIPPWDTCGLSVRAYAFKPTIAADIEAADLVIGHAGGGTCLEVLAKKKRFIVVINEDLMNNHQTELAQRLADDGHVAQCVVSSLTDCVRSFAAKQNNGMVPFEQGKPELFARWLTSELNACNF